MIVHEVYAVCDGCKSRRLLTDNTREHPAEWPKITVGDETHYYCSRSCLIVDAADGGLSIKRLPRLPYALTKYEVDHLELIAMGLANKEIARHFGISESTAKNHINDAFTKLGANYRIEAILLAHAAGVLNLHKLASEFAERRRRLPDDDDTYLQRAA